MSLTRDAVEKPATSQVPVPLDGRIDLAGELPRPRPDDDLAPKQARFAVPRVDRRHRAVLAVVGVAAAAALFGGGYAVGHAAGDARAAASTPGAGQADPGGSTGQDGLPTPPDGAMAPPGLQDSQDQQGLGADGSGTGGPGLDGQDSGSVDRAADEGASTV
ncbi:hypothetical protein [Aeromicrobium sp. 50.2.37]|uniref:hypothetical protein n=1 Tax=Aeromicrobium sp. 50.2.37 TaxID=2969305 RepID=UPI00214FA884|nr:hypothetical protein [Aeromicrobium sp. 50.2.37]MCR4514541.1 hypothetical protein [Aeromicrobium sp. 50.2.37]